MAVVLGNRNDSGFGAMNSSLPRGAPVASSGAPSHGAIGSGIPGKKAMSPESLVSNGNRTSVSKPSAFRYPISPPSQTNSADGRALGQPKAAILMRKLPRNLTVEALRSMLIFAKDLVEVNFAPNEYEEDANFLTARAMFVSLNAAKEAQAMLHGKPNSTGEANMIVEIMTSPSNTPQSRRNTVDNGPLRGLVQSISPPGSIAPVVRQSSRFNGTFQSMERVSPGDNGLNSQRDSSTPDGTSKIQSFFSPQSPVPNGLGDRQRQSSKAVINDGADDDTGAILSDPVAFMNNDFSASNPGAARRQTNPQIPLGRFGNLSLSTDVSPPSHGFASPRSSVNVNSPSTMSPSHMGMGTQNFSISAHPYSRHNYPPVNPADQNPPCNTLYVGNLPIDTSEDELKALFSKQRGYKRLCFRTKHNGPMCFVEFEDVSFATKTLNELYGFSLHNSVKGGIRLSFSKNPLGVRSGQPGSSNPSVPVTPQTSMSPPGGLGNMSGQNFGPMNPPPGLAAPPGLSMPMTSMGPGAAPYTHSLNPIMSPMTYTGGSGANNAGMGSYRGAPGANGNKHGNGNPSTPGAGSGPYPDYMYGR